MLGFGFGIAAAVLLPRWNACVALQPRRWVIRRHIRLEKNAAKPAFSPPSSAYELVGGHAGSLWWYVGAVAVALAFMAPVVARRWRPLPFFVLMTVLCLVLALPGPTPLNAAFGAILPRFEEIHGHAPYRVLILVGPAIALLAAATITFITQWHPPRAVLLLTAAVPTALAIVVTVMTAGDGSLLSRESTLLIGGDEHPRCLCLVDAGAANQTDGAWRYGLARLVGPSRPHHAQWVRGRSVLGAHAAAIADARCGAFLARQQRRRVSHR